MPQFAVAERYTIPGAGNFVYDVNTLDWVRMTQPIVDGGSISITGTMTTSSKIALTASIPTSASVGTSSSSIVASNGNRKSLIIKNLSVNTISFGLGQTAILNSGLTLAPYEVWTMNEYTFVTGAINAIASDTSSAVSIQEFN